MSQDSHVVCFTILCHSNKMLSDLAQRTVTYIKICTYHTNDPWAIFHQPVLSVLSKISPDIQYYMPKLSWR